LIGPLHGALSPNLDRWRKKIERRPILNAHANSPLRVGATGRRAGKTNAALIAPLQGSRLCRLGAAESIAEAWQAGAPREIALSA
jgi:hypothetical protein